MKKLVFYLIFIITSLNSYALTDAEYKELLLSSANFTNADTRLKQVWKELNSSLKNRGLNAELKKLLSQQRKWIREGRDIEARKYLKQGYSYADAYTTATSNRAAYLEERLNNLTVATVPISSSFKNWQQAYQKVAENFVYKHKWADGRATEGFADLDFSNNQLALADIDNDGELELLIEFTTGPTVSHQEIAYGFKDGKVFEKFSGYSGITFWTSGCAKVLLSHNQGLAGMERDDDFWPSFFYKFNPNTGKYEELGLVDSWSAKEFPVNHYDNDKPFPKELDLVGDGYLYFIDDDKTPVDTPVYKRFVQNCIEGGKLVKPKWVKADKQGLRSLFNQ